MIAPRAAHAKVTATNVITTLGARAAPDAVVRAEDVEDSTKLARLLEGILTGVAALKARWAPRKIDHEDVVVGANGALTRLAHHLAGRVRWKVVGWKTSMAATTDLGLNQGSSWLRRALFGPLTLNSVAGNFTVGVRFRCTSACFITGARFAWKASTRTVVVTLYLDSSGATLATGTAACSDSGVYTVTFTTPVTPALNVDMTLGVHDQAGVVYTSTGTDAAFTGLLPLALPGLSLRALNLFSGGTARPTTAAGTELYWVEPILASAFPELAEDVTTNADTLVLASYAPGTATIRVESAG